MKDVNRPLVWSRERCNALSTNLGACISCSDSRHLHSSSWCFRIFSRSRARCSTSKGMAAAVFATSPTYSLSPQQIWAWQATPASTLSASRRRGPKNKLVGLVDHRQRPRAALVHLSSTTSLPLLHAFFALLPTATAGLASWRPMK